MNKKSVIATYTFTPEHLEKLKKLSEETYTSISGLIRKALDKFFEELEKTRK
jgi:predicted DNA-binding protein